MDVVGSKTVVVGHEGKTTGKVRLVTLSSILNVSVLIINDPLSNTFEFDSRWVHLVASRTIATPPQTRPMSNSRNGLYCDALR